MDTGAVIDQLPILLGAGAGAAAKGAAGAAGKASFEKVRERLRGRRPAEAERLDALVAEIAELTAVVQELATEDDALGADLGRLADSVGLTLVAGSQAVIHGDVGQQVTARDVDTLNM